jgi:hypothetical protein
MVVLAVFMVLTAIALEQAVVKRALQAEEDGLQLLIYSLLAAVDRDPEGLSLTVSPSRLFEPGLVTRNSGLYALLYDRSGTGTSTSSNIRPRLISDSVSQSSGRISTKSCNATMSWCGATRSAISSS